MDDLKGKSGQLFIPSVVIRFGLFQSVEHEREKLNCMKVKKIAQTKTELDQRFDDGEDIYELIDMSKAKVIRHGKTVRITLDVTESLVNELDAIGEEMGVDRVALIKVWLYERIQQEKKSSRIEQDADT